VAPKVDGEPELVGHILGGIDAIELIFVPLVGVVVGAFILLDARIAKRSRDKLRKAKIGSSSPKQSRMSERGTTIS
jgi:hypothetical protein